MYVPIVPGCQALIIGEWPEYTGTECHVLEFCYKGSRHTYQGEPFEMYRSAWAVIATDGRTIDVDGRCLMRIDGPSTYTPQVVNRRSITTKIQHVPHPSLFY